MDSETLHTPPCRHFRQCGGCSLQHLPPAEYHQYKNDLLANIIRSLELDQSVLAPMITVGTHSRRRVEFKIAVQKKAVRLGFFAQRTSEVVNLTECVISEAALVSIMPALKSCLESLKKPGQIKTISLTILEAGLDALVTTLKPLKEADKAILARFAEEHRCARFSIQTEGLRPYCLYDTGKASIHFAGIEVFLPIGAFLQATRAGEAAITDFVTEHLAGCAHIADLYAGCGTYSFPLVQKAQRLSCFEGAEELSQALHNAALNSDLASKITTNTRDLFKNPLRPRELNSFDGIVINPPRNGALPQIKNIAQSRVGKVVMVYCNPSTFKRDLSHLVATGYTVIKAVAIDQFLWSNHLETVAYLEKE